MVLVSQKRLFGDESLSSTLELSRDGLLCGEGGRRCVLFADVASSVKTLVRVEMSDFLSDFQSSVIENLVIDGKNLPGVTGILLEDVMHCMVRNVTIRNCEVGVHIRSYKGLWSECNVLKHVCMENVKKGVVFTTTGPYYWSRPGQAAKFLNSAYLRHHLSEGLREFHNYSA